MHISSRMRSINNGQIKLPTRIKQNLFYIGIVKLNSIKTSILIIRLQVQLALEMIRTVEHYQINIVVDCILIL